MAPPFMNATGLVNKILDKVISAQQPERFTQDFLGTKLGYASGSAKPFIPLMKRIGLLGSDGIPTSLYSQFRNPDTRGAAMAQALRIGYKDVYERNDYAHDLTKDKFKNLIVEMTGLTPTDGMVGAIVNTFFNLKSYANFDQALPDKLAANSKPAQVLDVLKEEQQDGDESPRSKGVGLNLSYTINLNLPETSDVEVFNAIFRSLKENLLKN